MDVKNPNTVTRYITLDVNGHPFSHHYYTRFIKEETELWCFCNGLGEQSMMNQLGTAFLDGEDPHLGRIILVLGTGLVAEKPFKGNFNIWWAWGGSETFISEYLEKTTVKPDLALACSKRLFDALEHERLNTIMLPLGVGSEFKPLHLKRQGLGYAGADNKSEEQKQLMLAPFMERSDFAWHARRVTDEWWSETQLNEWYNSRQIMFGLMNANSTFWHQVGNRIFETYASGTPLVFPRHPMFKETFGFPQPYPVDKIGDAEAYVHEILGDFESVLSKFEMISEKVRKEHGYAQKLTQLFQKLKQV